MNIRDWLHVDDHAKGDRLGHDRRYAVDTTRSRTELGWAPEHTLDFARPSHGIAAIETGGCA